VVQRILPPGAESGKHTQSGNEIVYIQEGSVIFEAQGKPAVTLKPGEALINLSNARSSPWVGRRPMANSLSLATGVLSLIASVDKQVRHGWKIATLLLQLRVLRLGFFQDRDVGVGVFPKLEETRVCFSVQGISLRQFICKLVRPDDCRFFSCKRALAPRGEDVSATHFPLSRYKSACPLGRAYTTDERSFAKSYAAPLYPWRKANGSLATTCGGPVSFPSCHGTR